jgi:exopolysaccharide production protein ExoQ
MDAIEDTIPIDGFSRFCSNLAKFSFFVFLFFSFFGTNLPFQERLADAEEITTSSVFNQLVFSSLYILSLISLIPKGNLAVRIIKAEKFFTIFLLWSLISVFWSEVPLVSFKRWLRIWGMAIVILSVLVHLRSADETLQYFKIILCVYLPLSILSVFLVPGATQWEFPAWRGIAMHKNELGQISLVSMLVWAHAFYRGDFKNKILAFLLGCLSFILLMGSKSVTAILTAGILMTYGAFLIISKQIFRPVVGRSVSAVYFIVFFLGLIPVVYLGQDALASLPGLLGKDLTFSGRVYLWADVFQDATSHLLLGCGFGGYWVPGTPAMDRIWDLHVTLFNQAHLGYLDILNETGLVGIALFAGMVTFYFIQLAKFDQPHFWKFFLVSALISNLSETSFFKPLNLINVLFVFAYIALYVDTVKRREALV